MQEFMHDAHPKLYKELKQHVLYREPEAKWDTMTRVLFWFHKKFPQELDLAGVTQLPDVGPVAAPPALQELVNHGILICNIFTKQYRISAHWMQFVRDNATKLLDVVEYKAPSWINLNFTIKGQVLTFLELREFYLKMDEYFGDPMAPDTMKFKDAVLSLDEITELKRAIDHAKLFDF